MRGPMLAAVVALVTLSACGDVSLFEFRADIDTDTDTESRAGCGGCDEDETGSEGVSLRCTLIAPANSACTLGGTLGEGRIVDWVCAPTASTPGVSGSAPAVPGAVIDPLIACGDPATPQPCPHQCLLMLSASDASLTVTFQS